MAITNIHPIKSTLKAAIDYICNTEKTADEIYVSTKSDGSYYQSGD